MMIIPSLLLQEASKNVKSKDHLKALERPVELWDSRQLLDLLKEAETNSRSFSKVFKRNEKKFSIAL